MMKKPFKVFEGVESIYGANVFSIKVMQKYLTKKTFLSLKKTIHESGILDASIATEVAHAMKKWAISKGATHFCHWFQPLTGHTAEKHNSFIAPDGQGGVLMEFSAKELIQGESDASSFPSGGLRATFEARGYTAWDPTSPAFIKESEDGATLCIPTVFCGYHGEALDKKVPLLRSVAALSLQLERVGVLFGIEKITKPYVTLGAEQEYFLIDKTFYEKRLDLVQTGRTLLGCKPPRHQQMGDHYYSVIRPRILAFMEDLDQALWKLGIPAKTRHNEAAPAQFEIAPVFERLNLGVDHNMLCMEVMKQVADEHGLVCLLHEKPFAGVNGSGKHNNWSVVGTDGKNWLNPGNDPYENAKFLFLLCALMKAIDTHAALLRMTVASAGNDHRLGAHEAPPAIISIFLGDPLTEVLEQIEKGLPQTTKKCETIQLGVDVIPSLPQDTTDRNRTSSIAFTGNKFEFRALGSNMSPSGANVALNTIMAEALDEMCCRLEEDLKKKKDFHSALQDLLQDVIQKHKRVLFNGDNYTVAWQEEAKKRALPNLKTTPEALEILKDERTIKLFEKYGIFCKKELLSRYDIYLQNYKSIVTYESACMCMMVSTQILPAVVEYQSTLANTVLLLNQTGSSSLAVSEILKKVSCFADDLSEGLKALDLALQEGHLSKMHECMNQTRKASDALEGLIPSHLWPLPTYAEMLFLY